MQENAQLLKQSPNYLPALPKFLSSEKEKRKDIIKKEIDRRLQRPRKSRKKKHQVSFFLSSETAAEVTPQSMIKWVEIWKGMEMTIFIKSGCPPLKNLARIYPKERDSLLCIGRFSLETL